ncbi:hypothetical protein EV673_1733 [Limnobacter thiooxidans]|uniref:Uncharacterized protein n=2 Tax=Burkholderiaceae TaxID=119060 RepID=A0AA86MF01_9BURK|nr:hypothetical protein EV673_1733 [Limnobacter thiooxidans]BET27596.1 hypothetical protein RGQ30_30970 [Limnobacter thiooxidans]
MVLICLVKQVYPEQTRSETDRPINMKITPTLITAAMAGVLSGIVMPILWPKLIDEGGSLVIAFLIFVAFPAHAFVMGFGRQPTGKPGTVDMDLLKRVGVWLGAAMLAMVIAQAV